MQLLYFLNPIGNGDSGSSFYLIENSSPILLGVVSVGIQDRSKKCKNNAYAIFSDVFKFVDWIKKEVGSGYLIANKKNSSINMCNLKNK